MKKFICIYIILLILTSCVSNDKFVYGRTVTDKELETIEIIGQVETAFETSNKNKNDVLLERAYYELLKEAKKNYTGEIDIKNIIIEKRKSNKNVVLFATIFFPPYASPGISYANIYARGEVIKVK